VRDADEVRALLSGPVNPLPTKFHPDGTINFAGMHAVIDRSLDAGCQVIMLTWGETLVSLLSDAELAEVHRSVITHVGDRALTIACDNMWGLHQTLEFGDLVRDLGYDLYMVRPAEWARGTPDSLADFYRAVARRTPVMLVGDVPIGTCELIADEPGIRGFKEDTQLDYAHEVLMRWGDRWPMVGGGGMKRHFLLWPHGCRSWLEPFVRCYPDPAMRYWHALQRGDTVAAWEVVMGIEKPVREAGYRFRAGYNGFSQALIEIYGVAPRWRRSPAPNATESEMNDVRGLLKRLGIWP
jgi:dihydrodipicolinate synthase/N-acetylneuraminate lyase